MAHTVAPLELRPPEQAADPAARGRTCARRQDFVLDLGRDCFLVADGRVERWSRESGHARFLVYCADYGPTASVGVAQAPGSLQYAEILVRKRLEERGELTADTQLLVYEKHKTVSGDIRVVYQIAPKLRVAEVLRCLGASWEATSPPRAGGWCSTACAGFACTRIQHWRSVTPASTPMLARNA
jgi:hypothetical protein